MYRPYINYVDVYFPNAISVVDSFHVIKMITGKLQAYLRRILRSLHDKDEQRHAKLEQEFGRKIGFLRIWNAMPEVMEILNIFETAFSFRSEKMRPF